MLYVSGKQGGEGFLELQKSLRVTKLKALEVVFPNWLKADGHILIPVHPTL